MGNRDGAVGGALDAALDTALAERLRAAVRAALGRAAVPRILRAVPRIPLRGIGKPDRAATARLITAEAAPAPNTTASHPRTG